MLTSSTFPLSPSTPENKLETSTAPRPLSVHIMTFIGVVFPFLGIIAAAIFGWGSGFTWLHLSLLAAMYMLTAVGITVGFHRLFTHRAFETTPAMKAIFAVLGCMAFEGPLFRWVATHRKHHQYSDDAGDPHSPHNHGEGVRGVIVGAWHAHVGWIFGPDAKNLDRYIGDLTPDKVLSAISKNWLFWSLIGLAVPAVLGGVISQSWWGVLLGFIWGGLARVFLVHHTTWSINSVCHLWGARPYDSRDESRNNVFFGVFGLGEGWHNNHHAFPTSARHGLRWWQIDLGYYLIRGLQLVGLAWKVKVPGASQIRLVESRHSAAV